MPPTIATDRISYVSDDSGRRTAAIVPIEIWQKIESEIENRYLLDNPVMRQRLLGALKRAESIPLDEAVRKLPV